MFPCEMGRYIAVFPQEARKLGRFWPVSPKSPHRPAWSRFTPDFGPRTPGRACVAGPPARPSGGTIRPLRPTAWSGHHIHFAVSQPVDTADHLQLALFDRSTEDRCCGAEFGDVVDHVLPDRLAKRVAT